jgi:hypothetical protein
MSPNAPRYQQFSDNANVDLPQDESAFSDSYGSSNHAGRTAKRRIVFRVDADGRYVGLGLVSFDPKDVYTANAAWVRNAKPIPMALVHCPVGAFQRPDGSWASWMEMVTRWEHQQHIDESRYRTLDAIAA